jgi:hypothetical protein
MNNGMANHRHAVVFHHAPLEEAPMTAPILPTDPRFIDLTGQRFERWLVLGLSRKEGKGYLWNCRCDCGTEKEVRTTSLRGGGTRSCGCLAREVLRKPRKRGLDNSRTIDLAGKKFSRWLVESFHGKTTGKTTWNCVCDCGNKGVVASYDLRNAKSLSCGCLQKETASRPLKTGGRSQTPLYKVWASMINRCTNPRNTSYKTYGGRGIGVCKGWSSGFPAFLADMGERPTDQHQIDRIDNQRGYDCGHCEDCVSRGAKANCRWVTPGENSRNRKSTRMLTHEGRTLPLIDWANELGVCADTILARLAAGWDVKKTLTQKPRSGGPRKREVVVSRALKKVRNVRDALVASFGLAEGSSIFAEVLTLAST